MSKNLPKNSEIAVLEVWILQKFSLPPIMVGALTQCYIKNGGSKIRLHKTLFIYNKNYASKEILRFPEKNTFIKKNVEQSLKERTVKKYNHKSNQFRFFSKFRVFQIVLRGGRKSPIREIRREWEILLGEIL